MTRHHRPAGPRDRAEHRADSRADRGGVDDAGRHEVPQSPAEPEPLHFRHATLADTNQVVALVESAYRGSASRAGWTTEADLLDGRRTGADDIADVLSRPRSLLLLGERGGALVACAHVGEDEGNGYFGMFAVSPLDQGGGIGKQVLAEAERIVRDDWSLPAMHMTVIDVREALIAFYERRGYHRTGIHRPFPYGDERFGIPLRQDLRFELLEKRFR